MSIIVDKWIDMDGTYVRLDSIETVTEEEHPRGLRVTVTTAGGGTVTTRGVDARYVLEKITQG